MTLVKAYTNNNDFAYYKTFCKEGVTNTMVSLKSRRCSVPPFFTFHWPSCRLAVFQGIPQILSLGLCPAMLTPSRPCELDPKKMYWEEYLFDCFFLLR